MAPKKAQPETEAFAKLVGKRDGEDFCAHVITLPTVLGRASKKQDTAVDDGAGFVDVGQCKTLSRKHGE